MPSDPPTDAYARTDVDLWLPRRVRVAGRGAVTALPFEPVVVITGHNPRSEIVPAAVNAQANADLAAVLLAMGADLLPAEGRGWDGHWPPEASFAVRRLPLPLVLAVGRAFRQHAVYVLGGATTAIVSCDEGTATLLPRLSHLP